jgi:hypothetical protein
VAAALPLLLGNARSLAGALAGLYKSYAGPYSLRPFDNAAPLRKIVDFFQDAESHWVAQLSCGHGQHVRHEPPMQNRPWVLTVEGRQLHVGTSLSCMSCLGGESLLDEARGADHNRAR